MTTTTAVDRAAVIDALARVRDPELDEPITGLRFVDDVRVRGGTVEVDLRLPTYFCAPNFAYLMVADARDELSRVPGPPRSWCACSTTSPPKRSTRECRAGPASPVPSPVSPTAS